MGKLGTPLDPSEALWFLGNAASIIYTAENLAVET